MLLLHDFLLPSTRLFRKLSLFVLDVLRMLLDHLELWIGVIIRCLSGADLWLLLLSKDMAIGRVYRPHLLLILRITLGNMQWLWSSVVAAFALRCHLLVSKDATFALRLLLGGAGCTLDVRWIFLTVLLRLVAIFPLVFVDVLHILINWAKVIWFGIVTIALLEDTGRHACILAFFGRGKWPNIRQILLRKTGLLALGLTQHLTIEHLNILLRRRNRYVHHRLRSRYHHRCHSRHLHLLNGDEVCIHLLLSIWWNVLHVSHHIVLHVLHFLHVLHILHVLHWERLLELLNARRSWWHHLDASHLFH